MATETLARFACRIRYADLPPRVVEQAKRCLLDTLAAAFAARDLEAIHILHTTLAADGLPPGEATVIGCRRRTAVLPACLLNAAMAQSQELDDFCKPAILHIGSTAIPPALAAAQALGKSGRELLAAIVAGYEVGIRVGEAVNPSHHTLWHTTGTCGTFAAAAATGKLLGLDQEAMINALGTAGTQAAGLNQYMIDGGEMSKPLHAGKAAMNGCLAALLAQRGFTGARHIFEGDKGFCRATSSDADLTKLVDGLDPAAPDYKILTVTQRLYPVNGHILSVLTGLFALLDRRPDLQPADIADIEVGLYAEAYNFLSPVKASSPFLARFHLPFCVALAVHERRLVNSLFTPANLHHPALLAFMDKVRLYEDPALTAAFPQRWMARVRLVTTAGDVLTACPEAARGDPCNPLNRAELVGKLQETAAGCLDAAEVERFASRLMAVESMRDVRDLL